MKITPLKKSHKKKGPVLITHDKSRLQLNHSKVDGIGAEVASIPLSVYAFLIKDPAFEWVFESNASLTEFLTLNPQFRSDYRPNFKTEELYSLPILNRDKKIYPVATKTQ